MKHDGLTDRQLEVARLVALGQTVKQIAVELRISERGVTFHIARIADAWHLDRNKDVRVLIAMRPLDVSRFTTDSEGD